MCCSVIVLCSTNCHGDFFFSFGDTKATIKPISIRENGKIDTDFDLYFYWNPKMTICKGSFSLKKGN